MASIGIGVLCAVREVGPLLQRSAMWASLAVALCAMLGGVGPARAQSSVRDIGDLGNEAVPLTESMARFMNTHVCITAGQLASFEVLAYSMLERLGEDFGTAAGAEFVREGKTYVSTVSGVSEASRARAKIRVENMMRALERNLREIRRMPPCVEPFTNRFTFGLQLIKTQQNLNSTERLASTGTITNQFSDSKDPLGVGVIVAYSLRPWSNNWVVSPFVSVDYLNMSVNRTFPSGSFLGTTSNFAATAGVKAGPMLSNGVWLYGIAGVSALNETLRVNFLPIASSQTTTVPGATVGVGGAIQPSALQGLGHPVSLFVEYQHTWWQDAQFNTPVASPAFNYNFRREDDTIKFGFMVGLAGTETAPPPKPAYPVKAPALK
ncbi:MAG: hypothetical protein AB1490_17775 [Pseudomonadota bacterium]